MMLRYSSVAGNQQLWKYMIGLIFVDVILMVAIWPISVHPSSESNKTQVLNSVENKKSLFSFFCWVVDLYFVGHRDNYHSTIV